MYVEQTGPIKTIVEHKQFAIKELTLGELELIHESLITYKQFKLQDPEVFKHDRRSCIEMQQKINLELINSRT